MIGGAAEGQALGLIEVQKLLPAKHFRSHAHELVRVLNLQLSQLRRHFLHDVIVSVVARVEAIEKIAVQVTRDPVGRGEALAEGGDDNTMA